MRLTKKEHDRIWKTVKCNCGHYLKDHQVFMGPGGWCKKCGCTWYYPNDKYILAYRGKQKELRKAKKK